MPNSQKAPWPRYLNTLLDLLPWLWLHHFPVSYQHHHAWPSDHSKTILRLSKLAMGNLRFINTYRIKTSICLGFPVASHNCRIITISHYCWVVSPICPNDIPTSLHWIPENPQIISGASHGSSAYLKKKHVKPELNPKDKRTRKHQSDIKTVFSSICFHEKYHYPISLYRLVSKYSYYGLS